MTVDKILNTNQHIDGGWFWSKYSANPYLGCQYGCTYCFLRQQGYGISPDSASDEGATDSFAQNIRVKINAAEVLERELAQVPPDVIVVGDYQPVDKRYGLSRRLLEVCLNHGFPTLVIAKSPAVLRDLDLIRKIHEQSWACVVFSVAFGESGPRQRLLEPFASSIESRFRAMRSVGDAGIPAGTALMPVMPFINDDEENLRAVVSSTRMSGGRFVLAGGLVLGDRMESHFYRSLQRIDGALVGRYEQLYGADGYSPSDDSWSDLGRAVRDLCDQHGLAHRMKRYIPPGPLSANKRIAERIFLELYAMELEDIRDPRIPRLRQLAWEVDESATPLDERLFPSGLGVDELISASTTRRAAG